MNNIKFTEQLIKGKIAEMVFAQMIRSTEAYTILEFGYEKTLPELAQIFPKGKHTAETLEIIKRAPDFVVINHNKNHDVHLIEVKYMGVLTKSKVLHEATKISQSWKQASLFIATPTCFYYGTIDEIILKKGIIEPLRHPKISQKIQDQYRTLLNQFITLKK